MFINDYDHDLLPVVEIVNGINISVLKYINQNIFQFRFQYKALINSSSDDRVIELSLVFTNFSIFKCLLLKQKQ